MKMIGDLLRTAPLPIVEQCQDLLITRIPLTLTLTHSWSVMRHYPHMHREAQADFLEVGRRESCLAACARHPLNAASPFLNHPEFLEDSPNDPVAESRYTLPQILHRQAEWKQTRILDFQSIIEKRYTDRTAPLRIIGMDDSIDDRFP